MRGHPSNRPDDGHTERAAVLIHKRLAIDHYTCLAFHLHRRNYGHALIHLAMCIYDTLAVRRHGRRLL